MAILSKQPRRFKRRRLTDAERREREQEALLRASRSGPNGNDVPCILEFTGRGIPSDAIETFGPDQNVFTYGAWRAKGRQVRRGEKSVRLTVWTPVEGKVDDESGKREPDRMLPCTACVFHISQTDAIADRTVARC